MLVYLDNALSVGPDAAVNTDAAGNPRRRLQGLNENYGREVMELHTVGVDGGYTQADVTALAAILTGWGVTRQDEDGVFRFDPRRHEPGPKDWFGYRIDDDGTATLIGDKAKAVAPEVPAIAAKLDGPDG